MQRKDLIKAIAEKNGVSSKEAEKAVNMTLDAIRHSLINGETVTVLGFGTFSVKERGEHKAINPNTKETVVVPAKKIVAFKGSAKFLDEK